MFKFISTNDVTTPYRLDILMTLQPIDEASKVIKILCHTFYW